MKRRPPSRTAAGSLRTKKKAREKETKKEMQKAAVKRAGASTCGFRSGLELFIRSVEAAATREQPNSEEAGDQQCRRTGLWNGIRIYGSDLRRSNA